MIPLLILLASGALAGLVNGWLGLGGMSVFVPFLIHLYGSAGEPDLMAKVLANAFVVTLINGLVAWVRYHRHDVVDYAAVRRLGIGTLIGAGFAFSAAIWLHFTAGADKLLGGYLVATGCFVALVSQKEDGANFGYTHRQCVQLGLAGGIVSGLIGFNGNSFFAPFFRHGGLSIKHSVATAQVMGVLVSMVAVTAFALYGVQQTRSLFDGPTILSLSASSAVFNLWGTSIKHRMSGRSLTVWLVAAYLTAGLVLCLGIAH